MTTTLFNYIQSELIKRGLNEFVDDDGRLIFFDKEHQFITKILTYDDDIADIMNNLFYKNKLKNEAHDHVFKKTFLFKFINRQINRQTIEAFQLQLLGTFLSNEDYMNHIFNDLDLYIKRTSLSEDENNQTNTQTNKQINNQTTSHNNTQSNNSSNTVDSRQAFQNLPQSNVNIDVDNTIMNYASDNTINRQKTTDTSSNVGQTDANVEGETDTEIEGETTGTSTSKSETYHLDELVKSSGLMESVFRQFDIKCFMQVW